MLQLTFNPGLMLTGFRTTRPRSVTSFETCYHPLHLEFGGVFSGERCC